MKTLISGLLVVPGEAEINNANSHREIKSLQLLLSLCLCLSFIVFVFYCFCVQGNYYLKLEKSVSSNCGFKILAWRLLMWPTQDAD